MRPRCWITAAIAIGALVVACGARAQPTPNYQGLWWAAPAGSESGWGINFTHQGDLIFATWFTYDVAGRASWLSMTATRTGERTYAGDLVRTSGPAFSAQPFDPSRVARSTVGTGTLAFTDAEGASFTYTVDRVTQSKPLVRQSFGPTPACVQMPQPDLATAGNYQGLWWVADGAESGWGINLAHQGDTIFATWFTYDVDGAPLWLSATTTRQGASASYRGDILRTSGPRFDSFDASLVQRQSVGTVTIAFTDGLRAAFTYAITDPALGGPLTQAKPITRQPLGAGNPTVCTTIPVVAYRASDRSPFAPACEGGTQPGTPYANAEVEPHLAVDPRDPSHLIGAWQQDRWSNGAARGNVSAVSFDGGRTWTRSTAPFSRCTGGVAANGGDFERVSDPWVSIGADGIAYQIALAVNQGRNHAILASRSLDGGLTWSDPSTLIAGGSDPFNDKEAITADPRVPGHAYAVWDRVGSNGHGPTWFARTTDGGRTWEPARMVYDPGERNQTINNQVVVLPDGTLVASFTRFEAGVNGNLSASLALLRSPDRGTTWSGPVTIAAVQSLGASDPEKGTRIRDGANLGSIAVGPGGELAVVWQDSRFSGGARDALALSRSTDGGLTWSPPVRVNRDAGVVAFVPTVAIAGDGTIGVSYFDLRSNTSDPSTLFADYWLATSFDAGSTWRETRIAGPFDFAIAPNANGLFLGDYQGMVAAGNHFVPFYAAVNTGDTANRSSIFASPVATGVSATLATAQSRSPSFAPVADTYEAVLAPPIAPAPEVERRLGESILRTIAARMWALPAGENPGQ